MDLPQSRAYQLVDGSKKLIESGTLEVLQSTLDGADVYLLLLGKELKLALRHHVPCLEMAPRNFVFPTDATTFGLVLSEDITEEVLEVFRSLLFSETSFRSAAAPQPI